MKPRRGRPPNSLRRATREADAAIGRSVWQLLAWGYPLRRPGGVAETIGRLALGELGRAGHGNRELGPDQVEKIFKAWVANSAVRTGWVRDGRPVEVPAGRPWQMIQVHSLEARRPRNQPLYVLATVLLRNGGQWPHADLLPRYPGDQQFTPKIAAAGSRPTPDAEKRGN